jgi:hypothetical protein
MDGRGCGGPLAIKKRGGSRRIDEIKAVPFAVGLVWQMGRVYRPRPNLENRGKFA